MGYGPFGLLGLSVVCLVALVVFRTGVAPAQGQLMGVSPALDLTQSNRSASSQSVQVCVLNHFFHVHSSLSIKHFSCLN